MQIIEKTVKKTLLAASIVGLSTFGAFASDIRVGMVLEPPHLDPTAGAAARSARLSSEAWMEVKPVMTRPTAKMSTMARMMSGLLPITYFPFFL